MEIEFFKDFLALDKKNLGLRDGMIVLLSHHVTVILLNYKFNFDLFSDCYSFGSNRISRESGNSLTTQLPDYNVMLMFTEMVNSHAILF